MNLPGSAFHPVRIRTATALAVLAVTAGVLAAPAASAATGAPAAPSAAAPAKNGPIAYIDGYNWVEVNPDGSDNGGEHVVTPTGGGFVAGDGISEIVFSPDGTKAAFTDLNTGALWVANADGTSARQITTPVRQTNNYSADFGPTWSPDGSTVFFSRETISSTVSKTAEVLMSMPAAGGTAKAVLPTSDAGGDLDASLSPDGTKLAFTAMDANFVPSVVVADAKTLARITTVPLAWGPAYSPDGKSLAMTTVATMQAANADVSVGSPTGTGLKTVTKGQDIAGAPTWSPDGTRLAFPVVAGPSGGFDILIQDVATSQQARLSGATAGSAAVLSWQNGPSYTGPLSKPTPITPTKPAVERIGGKDRIGTSAMIGGMALHMGSTKAGTAVLSRDDNFADALAGNALAAQKNGGLFLTPTGSLDDRVAAQLSYALAPGSTVYLLGGPNALSPAVADAVSRLGFVPKRLAGPDRFSTATAIANEISPHPHTVLVATGRNFPDALAAGSAAATDPACGVVLLSDDKVLPAATAAYLSGVDPAKTSVYGVGNQGVAALNTMPTLAGRFVALAGGDRFDTATRVAADQTLFPHAVEVGLATGGNWPDALSGGALLGLLHAPLILADGASVPANEQSGRRISQAVNMLVFGGTQVVPDSAVTQAADAVWGPGNWTLTVMPTF